MKKILVVDDCSTNRLLVDKLLERIKLEIMVFQAVNGEEAVKMCENDDFDLILMDLQMPVLNGVEAATIIKDIKPNIAIFSMTAININCYDTSMFDGIMQKPFSITAFENNIKQIIGK